MLHNYLQSNTHIFQGWEFALLLFRSSLFRSKSLSLKSDSLTVALKQRAIHSTKFVVFTMFLTVFQCFSIFMPKSESLPLLFALSLFTKERRERFSLGKERFSISLTKNEQFARKSKSEFHNPDIFLNNSAHSPYILYISKIAMQD